MAKDILAELSKWKKELEDELKSVEKLEKDKELQAYTLLRKIEILETVSRTFEGERKEAFENSRIEPLKGSLDFLEKDIKSKKERVKEQKEEIQKTLRILQMEINNMKQQSV